MDIQRRKKNGPICTFMITAIFDVLCTSNGDPCIAYTFYQLSQLVTVINFEEFETNNLLVIFNA